MRPMGRKLRGASANVIFEMEIKKRKQKRRTLSQTCEIIHVAMVAELAHYSCTQLTDFYCGILAKCQTKFVSVVAASKGSEFS